MLGAILLGAVVAAGAAEPVAVADRFVEAVRAESLEPLAPFMEPRARRLLANELETYACVSVRDATVTVLEGDAEKAAVEVILDATAFYRGRPDREASFPREWRLDVRRGEDGWRLHSGMIRERTIARELAARESLTAEEIVRAAAGASLSRVLRELLDELTDHNDRARAAASIDAVEETARLHALRTVEAQVLLARGLVHLSGGEYFKADDLACRALERARQLGDEDLAASSGLLFGVTAWLLGDRRAALERYAEAMRTVGVANDPRPGLKARYMTGLLLVRDGELVRGLTEAARVGELAAGYGWSEGRCTAEMLQFEGHRILRDDVATRRHALASLSCARQLRDQQLVTVAMTNLAQVERAAGNRAKAREIAEEIVARTPESAWAVRAMARIDLALMMTAEGRYAEAERTLLAAFEESRLSRERAIEATVLAAMARVRLLDGRTALAVTAAHDANALMLRKTGTVAAGTHTGEEWAVRSTYGVALAAAGQRSEAMEVLRGAVDLIEKQRSRLPADAMGLSAFMADKDEAYRGLIGLLVEAGRNEEAVTVSERLRARALGDAVARGRVNVKVEGPDALITDAARLLPHDGEAILTFVVNEGETIGFLLHRKGDGVGITARRIAISRSRLERRVEDLRAAIAQRDLRYARPARTLHRLLLEPFVRHMAGTRRLYIVPEGVLWRAPFQALMDADGRVLLETMTVAFAPSLTLLRARRPEGRRRAAARGVLAVGDAVLPKLAGLPSARDEVAAIAAIHGPQGRFLTGKDATERALKEQARHFRIIHVATHSIINDAAPMYSSIALTPSGADDGRLEAREMLDLDLDAALVVLSSCESASGALMPGEGVVGMSWALMVAGSENALVTLVDVGSHSTARFMVDLHRRIARSDDYASALRQTQLAMMGRPETRHPFYWAPFVLICTRQER